MYHNAIKYGVYGWLAPGSFAFELYQAKKFGELKIHLIKLDEDKHVLEGATREQAKARTRELNKIQSDAALERMTDLVTTTLKENT